MKVTRNRIREIVKETLNKRLAEENPAEQPPQQGAEPAKNISALIQKIIADGGDEDTIAQLQKRVAPLSPEKKAKIVDAISRAVLGVDLGDKQTKVAVMSGED
jgi:hypothetical protein